MSVVLENDQIIITIPSSSPVDQLQTITSDLIHVLQFDDANRSNKQYFPLMLLEAMIPDQNTYAFLGPGEKSFNSFPLRKLLFEASPEGIVEYLKVAEKYMKTTFKKTSKDCTREELEILDSIGHLSGIIEAIEQGKIN